MTNEPKREPHTDRETVEKRHRRCGGALFRRDATLAADLVTAALRAPKLPPFQGD